MELTFSGEWRCSTTASGALCVIAPFVAVMQTSCAEWQATQALSVLCIIPDMVEDQVGSWLLISGQLHNNMKLYLPLFKVQSGWITLVVHLEMKYWKTAVASTGEATATTVTILTISE